VIFYADIWPGSKIDILTLETDPSPKMVGAIRLRINIEIPELHDPDYHVEATVEIEDDEDSNLANSR